MKKTIASLLIVFSILFNIKPSHAVSGEIIFRDAMYGALIGGLAGTAVYAIDAEDYGKKAGGGVLVGLILGTIFGVYESSELFAKADKPQPKITVPIKVETFRGDDKRSYTITKLSLIDTKF
jgi:hypothetical protein